MRIIDADKFLVYLILSKNIDGLSYGEVEEAIEMCKVDILGEIREQIETEKLGYPPSADYYKAIIKCLDIIDVYVEERGLLEIKEQKNDENINNNL